MLLVVCRSKYTTLTKWLYTVILKWGHALSVPKSCHSVKAGIQVGAQCLEAVSYLMSAFNCQTASSHRGLDHGFCKVWPLKLHLPMKKSNMIHALFFQKLHWQQHIEENESLSIHVIYKISNHCPFSLCLTSLHPLLAWSPFLVFLPLVPSCVFLLSCFPQIVNSAFKDSCSTICSHGTSPSPDNSLCSSCAQTQ